MTQITSRTFLLSLLIITVGHSISFGQWTTSGTNIYNSNTGNVGIGTSAPASLFAVGGNPSIFSGGQQVGFQYAPTVTTGNAGTFSVQLLGNAGANSTAGLYGIYSQVGTNTGNAANYSGNILGVTAIIVHRGTGIVSNGIGFNVATPLINSTGTITKNYGIYINPQQITGVTNGYGIYQIGANDFNYFAGNVSIGSTSGATGYKFSVNGGAIATAMTVQLNANWPDYVFKQGYRLPSLTAVKTYIGLYHHLPEIPTEEQIATNGLNLGEINTVLTKKVEELTLYLIQRNDDQEKMQKMLLEQQKLIDKLDHKISLLTAQTKKKVK